MPINPVNQIRSFFMDPITLFEEAGEITFHGTKAKLLVLKHAEKIFAAGAVGVGVLGFFVINKIVAPAIEKIMMVAKARFEDFQQKNPDTATTIKKITLGLGVGLAVGLAVVSTFKLYNITQQLAGMDVMPPGFDEDN